MIWRWRIDPSIYSIGGYMNTPRTKFEATKEVATNVAYEATTLASYIVDAEVKHGK